MSNEIKFISTSQTQGLSDDEKSRAKNNIDAADKVHNHDESYQVKGNYLLSGNESDEALVYELVNADSLGGIPSQTILNRISSLEQSLNSINSLLDEINGEVIE